ncbi:HTH-type transcriptional regulator CdhR [Pseudovibrio sp. Ad13]|uniref:GlxA family transcriptional regulator n=1 Tax=unclassified Pseudovibrio TaxID=2627060 RepID=UPI0007AE3CF3|nr:MULTISPECIES: GlxA family transcriptional regulator [unclassified Pseudovibrio]KZK86918.1 HTH-type transcriptional regulator CdhR [Pseudovibrio sp. Ad13]KZK98195.1 HTH-type transcriptional regulator CdhR [Pseudovibrio sp. W74]KZK99676.1 HTH-type transcriptional regulator CdhR [Pseudovibrio sp. Ad5]KZL04149.1 HTH-type transcriptional regulator CdhR [Pseudovibrio sp. Ad14]
MIRSETHHPIGILSYTGAQLSAVYGLIDMFHAASKSNASSIEATVLHEDQISSIGATTFSAIILPPCLVDDHPTVSPALVQWLKHQHEHGAILCSICVGAMLLAETGILDNRPATTHWAITEDFAKKYPLVQLDTDKMIVDEGDVITAGGIMAWTDLGLRLIDHFIDHTTMLEVSRRFLIDPAGREQKNYSRFYPNFSHGDQAILKAQHWLQTTYKKKLTVPEMAEKAGLTGRTFQRRFEVATGHTPNTYLQQLRITEARQQLEQTKRSFNEIAWDVGYEDPTACRRVFIKTTGLSPGQYRQKFGYQSAAA